MSLDGPLQRSNLIIVTGKGGVGKTVVAAAMVHAAHLLGRDVLHLDLDGRPHPPLVGPHRTILPDVALTEWLTDHGMGMLARRLARTGSLELIAGAVPGIRELLVLGRVKQLVRDGGSQQLVVLDAPASGHALTLLVAPRALRRTVTEGPIRSQADEVATLLEDHDRCQVVLVTLPSETPVTETVETAFALEDRAGVRLGPVVVNSVLPVLTPVVDPPWPRSVTRADREVLEAAAADRVARQAAQQREMSRLAAELPLPQVRLPRVLAPAIGDVEVRHLAEVLLGGRDG